jgi:hypothetical protein
MLGLMLSLLTLIPRLAVQAYQVMILIQAELLVWLQPSQVVVGSLFGTNRARIVLTIRLPTSSPSSSRFLGESAVQAVVRLLKGLDWAADPQQYELTGGMAAMTTPITLKHSKAARRRRARRWAHGGGRARWRL